MVTQKLPKGYQTRNSLAQNQISVRFEIFMLYLDEELSTRKKYLAPNQKGSLVTLLLQKELPNFDLDRLLLKDLVEEHLELVVVVLGPPRKPCHLESPGLVLFRGAKLLLGPDPVVATGF